MQVLQIFAALANHAQILIFEIANLSQIYSLYVMVNLLNSIHRLRHTHSFSNEHFTNSTTFRERKEELTIYSTCESRMKVDPDLKFLGVTENISSMPPVLGEPSPTLILILHIWVCTFLGSN